MPSNALKCSTGEAAVMCAFYGRDVAVEPTPARLDRGALDPRHSCHHEWAWVVTAAPYATAPVLAVE